LDTVDHPPAVTIKPSIWFWMISAAAAPPGARLTTDLETVILDLLEGQYKNPVRVAGFNTAEKWSEDVSADVTQEIRRRCDLQLRDVPFFLQDFVDRYKGYVH
jgi:hypothetical protein